MRRIALCVSDVGFTGLYEIVIVDDLERALIYFICERESKRVSKEIYPGQLLKAMFVNYSIKGDAYFFKHPTRSEILKLKEKLNTENNE